MHCVAKARKGRQRDTMDSVLQLGAGLGLGLGLGLGVRLGLGLGLGVGIGSGLFRVTGHGPPAAPPERCWHGLATPA